MLLKKSVRACPGIPRGTGTLPSGLGRSGKWEAALEERRKDALLESRKAEHLDKRALKEPLFSSSWRELAKESPKHL